MSQELHAFAKKKKKPTADIHTLKMIMSVTQSYLTLCDPMDCSPPGFSVHGIFPARILERVAVPFSRGSSRSRDRTWVSCIADRLFAI